MQTQSQKKLVEKYGTALKIKPVQSAKPMIKIAKLFTNEHSKEIILSQLVEQNLVLKDLKIEIEQFYETSTYNGDKYKCMIISTDLPSQTKILHKGFLLFNISEVKIYEYVIILQCANCLRYRHFARTCTFTSCCKKCTLNIKLQNVSPRRLCLK